MKESNKKKIQSLAVKRNRAREALYKVMNENEYEWIFVRRLKNGCEKSFVTLWDNYQLDSKFVEKEFFECCEKLATLIIEEHKVDTEFKKIYKPYRDKFQKLSKEYNQTKQQSQTSKTHSKKLKRVKK